MLKRWLSAVIDQIDLDFVGRETTLRILFLLLDDQRKMCLMNRIQLSSQAESTVQRWGH